MPRHFALPGPQILQSSGLPYSGALAYFYAPGTTTPQNVYSDSALTTPVSQPAVADSAGRWSQIYLQPIPYRIQIKTSGGVLIADYDNVDEGPGNTTGVTSVANGGTGATTAGGARSNLGLGTAAVVDTGTATGRVPLIDTGTWTPAMTFGGSATSVAFSVQNGIYTKLANVVFISARITLTNNGTGVGQAVITGLPFTANATSYLGSVQLAFYNNFASISNTVFGDIPNGTTTINLFQGSGTAASALTDTNVTNTADFGFSALYFT